MLGVGANLIKSAYSRGLAYVRDGLKLYMPYRGGFHDEVKFVGTGSTAFDGTDDYIGCGSDSTLNITGNITLSAWIKTSEDDHTIMGKWDNADGDGYMLYILSGGTVRFNTNNGYRPSTTSVNDGVWHHIAGTWDGTNGYTYIDGIREDGSVSGTLANPLTHSVQLIIGAFHSTPRDFFEGNIKNVAIWSRALTATEIQNVMYKTYDEVGGRLASGLVSWWALDATSLGSELITVADDRTFDSDTGFWTKGGSTTIESGVLKFAGSSALTKRSNFVTDGLTYQVEVVVSSYTSGNITVYAHGTNSSAINEVGTHTVTILAASTNNDFGLNATSAVCDVDSISVKEVNIEDLEGSNDGSNYGATIDTDLYGGDTPVKPRAIDNAPTVQADAIGAGSAFFVSSNADYIDCGTAIGTAFGNSYDGGLSVCAWIKASTIDDDQGIFTIDTYDGTGDSEDEFLLRIGHEGDGSIDFQVRGAGISTVTFTDTTSWHHVAAVFDGANNLNSLYLDGILEDSDSSTNSLDLDGLRTIIGSYDNVGLEPFNGYICQVGLWSKALNQAQVQSAMEKTYDELNADDKTSLVSYWPLDVDGTDSHGDNDGTLS